MAKLLVQESNGAREFELVDLEVNIGRELDNTLRLSDPSISRHHAVIRQVGSGYEIQDLESSNGVLVNGTRMPASPLQDGDRLTLGQMQLTFVDPRSAPPASITGTVRMSPEDMEKMRAGTLDPAPAPAQAAEVAAEAFDPPPPVPPPAVAPPLPGPAFLRPWLPSLPDPALPLRTAEGGWERGDFRSRFLAGLIDVSPLLALSVLALLARSAAGAAMDLDSLFGLAQLALLIGYLVLLPRCWMHFGASPGKKIMKLRVVSSQDPARRLDLNAAVLRLLGYLTNAVISWIVMLPVATILGSLHLGFLALKVAGLGAAILPYLLILGRERMGLEDRFSGSMVVKVDR